MNTANALKSIGLSANAILVLSAIGLGFYCYKNFYEAINVKLDIKLKKIQLAKEQAVK